MSASSDWDLAARRRLGRRERRRRQRRRSRPPTNEGMTFFDTADVYGDGRSERFCAELRKRHPDVFVATKMGRRVEQLTENYTRENFLRLERPLARKPRRAATGAGPAALPARRRVRVRCRVRLARPDGRRRADRRLRRVGRDRVASAVGDRPPPRGQRPDHPQLLSAQAARTGPPGGARGRRRDHRPGPAGVRAAVRAATTRTPRSPPTTTATSTAAAKRSTSARRSPEFRTRSGSRPPAGSASWSTRARRWRSSRCGG